MKIVFESLLEEAGELEKKNRAERVLGYFKSFAGNPGMSGADLWSSCSSFIMSGAIPSAG